MKPEHTLFDPLDTAVVQAEDTVLTALPLKVGLEFIPGAWIRSAIIAKNQIVRASVGGNSQPYGETIWALQLVVEEFRRRLPSMFRLSRNPIHQVWIDGVKAGLPAPCYVTFPPPRTQRPKHCQLPTAPQCLCSVWAIREVYAGSERSRVPDNEGTIPYQHFLLNRRFLPPYKFED